MGYDPQFIVQWEYPHSWNQGGVAHFESVEEAEEWGASLAPSRPGTENYRKITIYQKVKEVN